MFKFNRVRIPIFFVVLSVLFLARKPVLTAVGAFLVVQDPLEKVDVIIVLSGGLERVEEAARLYREGFSQKLFLSGPVGTMVDEAVRAGVHSNDILSEQKAAHTYEHPLFVKPILEQHNYKSAIIVSSPYHMRRSKILFNSVFKKSGIHLVYRPVRDHWFDPNNWWKNKSGRSVVISEYKKLLVNMFGAKFSDWAYKLL